LQHRLKNELKRRKGKGKEQRKPTLKENLAVVFYSLSLSLNFDLKIENKFLKHNILKMQQEIGHVFLAYLSFNLY
jgi:hypothetical protein